MATIRTSEDLIDLLRRDKGFRRDVVHWLGYRDPLDISDEALADADENSAAATPRRRRDDGERHDATLRAIHELTAEVIERTKAFETRMDSADARHQQFEARMDRAEARHEAFETRMDARHEAFLKRMEEHSAEMRTMNAKYIAIQGRVGNIWGADLERRLRREFRWVMATRLGCLTADLIWSADADDIYAKSKATEKFLSGVATMREAAWSDEEYVSLLSSDIIARGVKKGDHAPAWFIGEASGLIKGRDIRRAKDRADLLAQAMSGPTSAFAYGWRITDGARARRRDWRSGDHNESARGIILGRAWRIAALY